MPERHPYGPEPAQFGELHRPVEPRHPGVVVIILMAALMAKGVGLMM